MPIQIWFFLEYSKDMLRWSNMPYQHIKWMCVFTKKVRFLDPPQEKMFLTHFCVLAMDNLYFPASCSGYLLCGLQWISELSAPSFFSRQVLVEVNTCNEQWLFSNIIIKGGKFMEIEQLVSGENWTDWPMVKMVLLTLLSSPNEKHLYCNSVQIFRMSLNPSSTCQLPIFQ